MTRPSTAPPPARTERTLPERPALLVRLAALLVVVGAVGWRRGEYFSGSLDPVVVAKALVSLVALAAALLAAQSADRRRVGTGSLWLLGWAARCSVR